MKFIKIILAVLLLIIAVPLVIALFLKKDYHLSRSIEINQPKEMVYEYTKSLKNQNNYSTWTNKDPNVKTTFSGEDGSIGAKSTWKGNEEVGEGNQTITKLDFGKRIDIELNFIKPFEGKANAFFTFEALEGNKTKVIWGIDGNDPYPVNLMQLVIDYDKMMGPEFEKGLANLKKILEKESPRN